MAKTLSLNRAPASVKPRNRQPASLDILRVEIHWLGGVAVHDPNSLCVAGLEADYPFGQPFNDRPSVLSGQPGYLYKSCNLEIPLTLDELDRLIRLDLRLPEVLKLIEIYGIFHEVHDDFYMDGKSWQPRPKSPDFKLAKRYIQAKKLQLHLESETKNAPPSPRRSL